MNTQVSCTSPRPAREAWLGFDGPSGRVWVGPFDTFTAACAWVDPTTGAHPENATILGPTSGDWARAWVARSGEKRAP